MKQNDKLLEKVNEAASERLEDGESEINNISSLILNTEAWQSGINDDKYLDDEILKLYDIFKVLLGRASL